MGGGSQMLVCLHSGWVGVARCLRNQGNKQIAENEIFLQESYYYYNIKWIHKCLLKPQGHKNLRFFKEQIFTNQIYKNIFGVGGFSKILRNFQSGSWQMLMSAYKVGGWGEKRPKTCLRNI